MTNTFLQLIRIKHWVKNLLLFFPIFFGAGLYDVNLVLSVLIGAISFSLISSAFYVLNDLLDVKYDVLHPIKKDRPFASNIVSRRFCITIIAVLLLSGLLIAWSRDVPFFIMILLFIGINLSYNLGLKQVAILEMFLLASGYLLRVYAGGVLSETPISIWLTVMIFLVALFLILGKRKSDIDLYATTGVSMRESSKRYTPLFIHSSIIYLSSVISVAYIMYIISLADTPSEINPSFLLTILPVLGGIFRYLFLIHSNKEMDDPIRTMSSDLPMIGILILWIILFSIGLYG